MRRQLERFGSIAIGLLVCLAAVACLGGCGGIPDTSAAHLEKGDAILKKVAAGASPLLYQLESLFTDYAYGENTEPFGVALDMADYGTRAHRLAAMCSEAEAEYDKALAVPGSGGCKDYVTQAKAALQQLERIPGVAKAGFKVIDSLGNTDSLVGVKAMETALYRGSRTLIQIEVEMWYAIGYADYLAAGLGLDTRPSEHRMRSTTSGS